MLQTGYGCHFLVFWVVVEGITVPHVRKLKPEVITSALISFPAAATIEGMVYSWKLEKRAVSWFFLLGFGHYKTDILLLNWNFSWLPSSLHLKVRPTSKSFTLSLLGHVSFEAVVFKNMWSSFKSNVHCENKENIKRTRKTCRRICGEWRWRVLS